jgi:hypothetical protein
MKKQEFIDFIFNLMELKHYGKTYFKEKIEIETWKGDTSIDKTFRITIKEREHIPKNSEYFKSINKIFDKFDIDYTLDNGKLLFTMENIQCDKRIY